jgi:transposase
MARISTAISDQLLEKCKTTLKQQGRTGEISRRLQAIISAKHHNISKVALIFGITRVTMMKWIRDFDKESVKGLMVKKGRGRKKIFSKDYENKIYKIIKRNPDITAKQLQEIIEKDMSKTIGIATVYRLMRQLGFSYITPRKNHYQQDKKEVEDFKKKSTKENKKE